MFAAFFIHVVLLHAQVGSGLPLMGSTQSSPAAPTATAFRPIVLTVAATNATRPKPLVLVPGNPIIIGSASGGTQSFSDSFVRANGALGTNWTTFPGSDCAPTISSNLVVASAAPCTHSLAYYSAAGSAFSNNQYSQVIVGATPTATIDSPAVVIHANGSHLYNDAYTGTTSYRFGIMNPTASDIFTNTANVAPVTGDLLEVDAAGASPIFFWNRRAAGGVGDPVINSAGVDSVNLFTGGAPGTGVIEQNTVVTAKSGAWVGGSLPAFSSTPSDTFTRANAGWLSVNWWFPWHDDEGSGWILSSNKATPAVNSPGRWAVAIWTTALTGNQSIITVGNLAAGDWLGPIVRYTPTNANATDNCYAVFDNSGTLQIFARVAGSWTAIGSTSAYTAAPGDVIELDASGSNPVNLTAKVNGVTKITFSDATNHIAGSYDGFAALGTNTTTVSAWSGN